MNSESKKNNYIQLLKFIACILITNSHCIYPATSHTIASATSILQIGGGWGNALFFGIAGFLSVGKEVDFRTWIKKRYVRIIPLTLVFIIIIFLLFKPQASFGWCLISTYWFITALVIYYPVLYFIDKVNRGYMYGMICYVLGYIVIYFAIYDECFFVERGGMDFFKVYGFFGAVMMGAYIKRNIQKFERIKISTSIIVCLISGVLWAGVYGGIIFFGKGYSLQFLVTLSRILIVMGALSLAFRCNIKYPFKLKSNGIINAIANSTLEIYLVQEFGKIYIEQFISGGMAIFIFWSVAIIGGVACHLASNFRWKKDKL